MRLVLVRLHRCAGLARADVLCVAGVTGSLIAFQEEAETLSRPFSTILDVVDFP